MSSFLLSSLLLGFFLPNTFKKHPVSFRRFGEVTGVTVELEGDVIRWSRYMGDLSNKKL